MFGGKILGSPGKTGMVYDTCNKELYDNDTFCYTVKNMDISKICLIDYKNHKYTLDKKDKITNFINKIKDYNSLVTKTYYSSDALNDFNDEIDSIIRIYKCYGDNINLYTSLGHMPIINNQKIIGVIIYNNDDKNKINYYTFQSKCNQRFREIFTDNKTFTRQDMKIFLDNILKSVSILQKNNISHCDIKFDNIMTNCHDGNKFKLIDWNMSKELSKKNFDKFSLLKPYLRGSSPVYYSPYKLFSWTFYINNYTRDCMLDNLYKNDKIVEKCTSYARMCYSHFYNDIIPQYKTNLDLFKDLKFTTDLWSLGLMTYFIAVSCNLPEYIHISDLLCLLIKSPYTNEYIKNAEEVLYIINNFDFKQNNTCGLLSSSKGIHGVIIDLCCDLNINSLQNNVLCKYIDHLIKTKNINSLYIVNPELKRKQLVVKDIIKFNNSIKKYKNTDIAVKYYFNPKYAENDFEDDIKNSHIISNIFMNHENMITNKTINFNNDNISGIIIKDNNENENFYYFSNMCSQTIDKITFNNIKLNKFILNILSSLNILHSKDYYHGDIKTQNIMLCGRDFKLIDWGRLYNIKEFDPNYYYGGSMQSGSPLGFYFMIRNKTKLITRITAANIAVRIFEGSIPFVNSKSPLFNKGFYYKFKILWNNIKKNFINSVDKYSDIELFNKYKYTLDLYNLGLTILFIIYKNNIDIKKYKDLIKKLVLYNDDMITTTKDAIHVFKP